LEELFYCALEKSYTAVRTWLSRKPDYTHSCST